MSTAPVRRSRGSWRPPPGLLARTVALAREPRLWGRLGLAGVALVGVWLATGGWRPPFPYRTRQTPVRAITARAAFEVVDETATNRARDRARSETPCYYAHDPAPLREVQQALTDRLFQVLAAPRYEDLAPGLWAEFHPGVEGAPEPSELVRRQSFEQLRAALADDPELKAVKRALDGALAGPKKIGLLSGLQHDLHQGSQAEILVHAPGDEASAVRVDVHQVRIAEVADALQRRFTEELTAGSLPPELAQGAADRLFLWLRPRLPATLTWNRSASLRQADAAASAVEPLMVHYEPGDRLAPRGEFSRRPLDSADLALLRSEYAAYLASLQWHEQALFGLGQLGLDAALFLVCGLFLFHRERRLLADLRQLVPLLGLSVLAAGAVTWAARDTWRVEAAPLLAFGMTAAIAYGREAALVLTSAVALLAAVSLGMGIELFAVLAGPTTAAVFLIDRVRTRTKLVYVGLAAGIAAAAVTFAAGALAMQPFYPTLCYDAAWRAFCGVMTGLAMTGLLPLVEQVFDVQTDIRLLELGDAGHPLLQELARRAPGTYNHSLNVAMLSESAAECIGANGLLTRVGAYFHDVGKMLKPDYFVENQSRDVNRHDALVPAMSTLVIIAHVKDGLELGRRYGLPPRILDFIQQHHGTTMVEYFYRQQTRRCEADPDAGAVDEHQFRYPGPKPQTKEAGVLMLADAVESASRTLVDPAPARLESLVRDLSRKRLLDGQFDECGLTLRELARVEDNLLKSLMAVHHGRVKYPEPAQRTA